MANRMAAMTDDGQNSQTSKSPHTHAPSDAVASPCPACLALPAWLPCPVQDAKLKGHAAPPAAAASVEQSLTLTCCQVARRLAVDCRTPRGQRQGPPEGHEKWEVTGTRYIHCVLLFVSRHVERPSHARTPAPITHPVAPSSDSRLGQRGRQRARRAEARHKDRRDDTRSILPWRGTPSCHSTRRAAANLINRRSHFVVRDA